MELLSFKGRANRLDFWLIVIGLTLLIQFLGLIVIVLIGPLFSTLDESALRVIQAVWTLFLALLLVWPILAVGVRRAHDRGATGYGFIAFRVFGLLLDGWAATITWRGVPADSLEMVVLGAASLIMLGGWLFFVVTLGFLPGNPKANRYGLPPGLARNEFRTTSLDSLD